MPFRERYVVLDLTFDVNDAISGDEEAAWTEVGGGEMASRRLAVMHASDSRRDYERHGNSVRKKQRLRVDGVLAMEGGEMDKLNVGGGYSSPFFMCQLDYILLVIGMSV